MHRIKNVNSLVKNSPFCKERKTVLTLIEEAIDAIDPKRAVKESVSLEKNSLTIKNKSFDLNRFRKIFVVGAGKASGQMAEALEEILKGKIDSGIVNSIEKVKTKRIKIIKASHPIPDAKGVKGAKKILAIAKKARENDLVIVLISGGGSALLPCQAEGIKLKEMQKMNQLLIKSKAPIEEINAVRKHTSGIKGGLLAKAAFPATVISLIISDVIGDLPSVIASGPTAPDQSNFSDAILILKKYNLWNKSPVSIKRHLLDGVEKKLAETPKQNDRVFKNVNNFVILNNLTALNAMKRKATEFKLNPLIYSSNLAGEASVIGKRLVKEAEMTALESTQRPILFISGGETTVTLKGNGLGGRNQELVLGALKELNRAKGAVLASFATDGVDGNSKAAGAIADPDSLKRVEEMGLKIEDFLQNNDSFSFFKKLGDCIYTGYTKTNVMDLQLILIT